MWKTSYLHFSLLPMFSLLLHICIFYTREYVEKIERQYLKHIVMTAYQNHPYSLASFLGYLFLKEEEIYRITTALECIRYGLSEKEILGYILQDFRYQGGSA